MVITMLCKLLLCAFLHNFGYERQVAYWPIICVNCTLFIVLMSGFTTAVFHWLLKAPLSSDRLTILLLMVCRCVILPLVYLLPCSPIQMILLALLLLF